jgi:CRP/FNR family cyclic AMP-dependent transcriptional regulator
LRHAHQRVSSLALDTVRERLVRQLWLMSVDQAGKRVVPHKVSRQMLANMLGASREMVSRVMAELSEEGMIGSLPDGMIWLHAAPL